MDHVTVITWDYCLQYTFSKGWETCPEGFFFLLFLNCCHISDFIQYFTAFCLPLSSLVFHSCINFLDAHTIRVLYQNISSPKPSDVRLLNNLLIKYFTNDFGWLDLIQVNITVRNTLKNAFNKVKRQHV